MQKDIQNFGENTWNKLYEFLKKNKRISIAKPKPTKNIN